jgi:hypothetical protein
VEWEVDGVADDGQFGRCRGGLLLGGFGGELLGAAAEECDPFGVSGAVEEHAAERLGGGVDLVVVLRVGERCGFVDEVLGVE